MDIVVKKQIVGTLALIFIVVVFLPLFFSGEGYKERHLVSIIPEKPAVKTFQNIQPLLKPLPDSKQIAAEQKPVVVDQASLDEEGVPTAWTLQLASFKDEANAKALRKQLLNSGHKVYTRKNGNLVKVYVGPELKKERLEALKQGLKQDFGLDGLLVRFITQ